MQRDDRHSDGGLRAAFPWRGRRSPPAGKSGAPGPSVVAMIACRPRGWSLLGQMLFQRHRPEKPVNAGLAMPWHRWHSKTQIMRMPCSCVCARESDNLNLSVPSVPGRGDWGAVMRHPATACRATRAHDVYRPVLAYPVLAFRQTWRVPDVQRTTYRSRRAHRLGCGNRSMT